MDVKEKLVELILHADNDKNLGFYDLYELTHERTGLAEYFADYLIAHGVTVQEWISVKDRLPEQGQEVIVYSGGVLKPTVFAYQFWNKNYDSWARITHWLPLPQPPKGE